MRVGQVGRVMPRGWDRYTVSTNDKTSARHECRADVNVSPILRSYQVHCTPTFTPWAQKSVSFTKTAGRVGADAGGETTPENGMFAVSTVRSIWSPTRRTLLQ